ncbi:MAG: hypothetical protein ACRD43_00655, partial [Pyrinomonadaceae bacterium]
LKPRGGTWDSIVKTVETYLPSESTSYLPSSLVLMVSETTYGADVKPWPFRDLMVLNTNIRGMSISDQKIIGFLFDHLENCFSFFCWNFEDNNKKYLVILDRVPGWYQDGYDLRMALSALKLSSKKGKRNGSGH